jgi:hypothetical protein
VEPVIGDFNNDGIPDIAVAVAGPTGGANGTVNVFLGNDDGTGHGDGTFSLLGSFPAGINPNGLRGADLIGNGNLDLVVGNFQGSSVSVLLGNGDGTFQAPVSYPAGSGSDRLAIGDFTGNGIPDIAVGNFFAGSVTVLLGNGDGTFRGAGTFTTGNTPAGVEVGDLAGNGLADITVDNEGSNTVSVLLSNGDGTFKPAVNYSTGPGTLPFGHALVDLTGTGILDIVAGDFQTNSISVLMGNGDGTFQAAVSYPAGPGAIYAVPGDFNGDGIPDIATANYNSNTVSVMLGNGDGSFQPPQNYPASSTPLGIVAGDLRGVGFDDLVTTSTTTNNMAVLLNDTMWVPAAASFHSPTLVQSPPESTSATIDSHPNALLERLSVGQAGTDGHIQATGPVYHVPIAEAPPTEILRDPLS